MIKGLLIHVGIDSSNLGVVGPIFNDRKFEFIPIDEGCPYPSCSTYSDLKCRNKKYGRKLADFLPSKYQISPVHLDPDFAQHSKYYWYGEPLEGNSKARAVGKLKIGDIIFLLRVYFHIMRNIINTRMNFLTFRKTSKISI